MAYFIDIQTNSLLGKVIPPDIDILGINSGFLLIMISTAGKIFGAVLQTLAALPGEEYLLTICYSICAGLFFISILLFVINYQDLRVKALSRILKNNIQPKV